MKFFVCFLMNVGIEEQRPEEEEKQREEVRGKRMRGKNNGGMEIRNKKKEEEGR